ncbi:hypothetical protein GCM10028801_33360 [Nocardioides maradonensis]
MPPPYLSAPVRRRPRFVWFFVGGGLLVLALSCFVTGLVLTLHRATATDAVIPADGTYHAVTVPAGGRRALYVGPTAPATHCDVTQDDGRQLVPGRPRMTSTVTVDGRTWVAIGSFTPTTAHVEVSCTASGAGRVDVRVGAELGAGFVVGILVTILLPLLLGLAGGVVLLVTIIRRVTSG